MRTKFAAIFILCGTLLLASFVNPTAAQVGGQVQTNPLTLYFTNQHPPINADTLDSVMTPPCGNGGSYNLTTAPPPTGATPGKAYLNRAALVAGSLLECKTDWVYTSTSNVTMIGHANVTFQLNCDHPGLIQSGLESVVIGIYRGTKNIGDKSWDAGLLNGICTGAGAPYDVAAQIPVNGTTLQHGQAVTVRVDLRAVNTEQQIVPYWYIMTAPRANMTVQVEDVPECRDTFDNDGDNLTDFGTAETSDPGCTSTEDDDETDEHDPGPACSDNVDNDADGKVDFGTQNSNDPGCTTAADDDETDVTDPECSDTVDNDNDGKVDFGSGSNNDSGCTSTEDDDETDDTEPTGGAPNCARDDPSEAEIVRPVGQAFTLMAVCADPDDDLGSAEWTVDDQPHAPDELGASPADVDEEFTFDAPGSHVIEVTATDQEGQGGGPASWVVHIVDDSNDGDAPSCARESPGQFDVTQGKGEAFTLTARCTDPDNDLNKGNWVVDDEPAAEDDLGESPAAADEEFQFDECGTHHIHFVPTDEAGNVGSSASWRVTINGCPSPTPSESPGPSESPSPTQTTPIPVFPSSLAFVLAAAGGLGGGFLILRRRGA